MVDVGKTIFSKQFENDAIAVGGNYRIPLTDDEKYKYGSFNGYSIFNLSAQPVTIRYGQSTTWVEPVPANSGVILDWTEGRRFYELILVNDGAAQIAAGSVKIVIKTIVGLV